MQKIKFYYFEYVSVIKNAKLWFKFQARNISFSPLYEFEKYIVVIFINSKLGIYFFKI